MKIEVLGAHNTESRNTRYMSLLIDNVLAVDAGGITSALTFEAQQKIKALLLTHHHYDHLRDVPALAMNLFLRRSSIKIYASLTVRNALTTCLLNGDLYPKFLERPPENPTVQFTVLEPHQTVEIEKYRVTAIPMSHSVPDFGYQISSADNRSIFYTGDTGPGLAESWHLIAPQILFIEVTASNRWEESIVKVGHLSPNLLKKELLSFREIKGYLPQVVAVHINPENEGEMHSEISRVSSELGIPILLAYEGMKIEI